MVRESPRDFVLIEALWRLGLLWPGELPRAAIAAVDSTEGQEDLYALTAFTHPNWNGIGEAFDRAWSGLRGQRLSEEEAGRRVAMEIARFVRSERLSLAAGLRAVDDVAGQLEDEVIVSLCMLQARMDVAPKQPTRAIMKEAKELMARLAGDWGSPGAQPTR